MTSDMHSRIIELEIIDAQVVQSRNGCELLFSLQIKSGFEREFRLIYHPCLNSNLQYEIEVEFPEDSDVISQVVRLDGPPPGEGILKLLTPLEELPVVLDSISVAALGHSPLPQHAGSTQFEPTNFDPALGNLAQMNMQQSGASAPALAPGNVTSSVRNGTLFVQAYYSLASGTVSGTIELHISPFITTHISNATNHPGQDMIEFDCGASSSQPTGATYQVLLSDSTGPCPAYPSPAGSWPPS